MFLWTAATNFRMVRLLCNANSYNYDEDSEAVVPRCSVEKAKACNFIKKETLVQVSSCEFLGIFKNTFFYKTPPVAASEENQFMKVRFSNEILTKAVA